MTIGATFRKCDFQIHSPRDRNWIGPRPAGIDDQLPGGQTPSETDVIQARRDWADGFINACVEKGLQAVALTDHHEMLMAEHVRDRLNERLGAGEALDVWFFPGIELTVRQGVQCIVLFDGELDASLWAEAQSALGISQGTLEPWKASCPHFVEQLALDYVDVGSRLEEHGSLRGRYIVLPNVSQGQHSVLRNGWHKLFRGMEYVGGYLDRGYSIETMSAKNRRRLSGKDSAWGPRSINPLPTSDSRDASFAHLGTNETWIKLSAVTAESLRQAFLAHQSRIRIHTPELPQVRIDSISVRGAKPLADVTMAFNPELNAIIGGRGCGKSTLIEYLAFGLGRSCYDLRSRDYSGSTRLAELIRDTLVAENAQVRLRVVQDEADFEVMRGPASAYQPQITYPSGETESLSPEDLRSLISADVYNQGELSEIGRAREDRTTFRDILQFVQAPFLSEADTAEQAIREAKDRFTAALQTVVRRWRLEADLTRSETRVRTLRARVEALQKTVPKLDDADQEALDKHEELLRRHHAVLQLRDDLTSGTDDLFLALNVLTSIRQIPETKFSDLPSRLNRLVANLSSEIRKEGERFRRIIEERLEGIRAAVGEWEIAFQTSDKVRADIIGKRGAQQTICAQIAELQKNEADEIARGEDIQRAIDLLGKPEDELKDAWDHLKKIVNDYVGRLNGWASFIQNISDGMIAVDVKGESDISEILAALDVISVGTGSQEAVRIRNLSELLKDVSAWKVISTVINELGYILRMKLLARLMK